MDYREFPFWKETYELCGEIASIARCFEKSGEPFCRMLSDAVEQVPMALINASMAGDDNEMRTMFLRVVTGLQTAAWVLFSLGMRGDVGETAARDFLRRSAGVECAMLAFYRERCV